jgi:hypothetical protein
MTAFCLIDDKHVPLHRIMWISALPHFCGSPQCQHEGDYEIRLEQGESVWADQAERDNALAAVEAWQSEPGFDEEEMD